MISPQLRVPVRHNAMLGRHAKEVDYRWSTLAHHSKALPCP